MVGLDSGGRAVIIEPAHEKKLLSIEIILGDSPGSLAGVASCLAALGVDLVSTQSSSSDRGKAAIWHVECNPGKASIQGIKSSLAKAGAKLLSSQWE